MLVKYLIAAMEKEMKNQVKTLLVILFMLFSIAGCYSKPVRHLASDIALVKVGESTQEDVIIFLGQPDEEQEDGDGVLKWLYQDEDLSLMEKTPFIGTKIGSPLYRRAVVTIKNGVVVDAVYSSSDEDDMDWADDYSWQVKKK